MSQFPKTNYFRSKAMMEIVRTFPCGNCGAEDGTVCGAHPNWSWAGKGKSIKADDVVAALCHKCHHDLDQGPRLTRQGRETMWLRAFYETVRYGLKTGALGVVK